MNAQKLVTETQSGLPGIVYKKRARELVQPTVSMTSSTGNSLAYANPANGSYHATYESTTLTARIHCTRKGEHRAVELHAVEVRTYSQTCFLLFFTYAYSTLVQNMLKKCCLLACTSATTRVRALFVHVHAEISTQTTSATLGPLPSVLASTLNRR